MQNYRELLTAFRSSTQTPPADLAGAIRNLTDVGALPSPWLVWTLIVLVRHSGRQQWVAEVANRIGSLPDHSSLGIVPGEPLWEYRFHGIGCRLTHRVTGEMIDVDFHGGSAEFFDIFLFCRYLTSLRKPDAPEQRLLALHPSVDPVRLAIHELVQARALEQGSGLFASAFCIAAEAMDHLHDIESFCQAWDDEERRP
jgi:hypothetical protein